MIPLNLRLARSTYLLQRLFCKVLILAIVEMLLNHVSIHPYTTIRYRRQKTKEYGFNKKNITETTQICICTDLIQGQIIWDVIFYQKINTTYWHTLSHRFKYAKYFLEWRFQIEYKFSSIKMRWMNPGKNFIMVC